MKTNIFNKSQWAALLGAMLLVGAPVTLSSCKEDISEDAFAVKTEDTMIDYISKNDSLTDIKAIFDEVRLGRSANASVLSSVLSARGNYTVFAPNNKAIREYLKSKGFDSLDESVLTNDDDKAALKEIKQRIALNCIIDNGASNAYEIADLSGFSGTIPTSNLNNRRLDISEEEGTSDILINSVARIVKPNVEVSNGMLHIVDHVIAPSVQSVAKLIQSSDNLRIMGQLLAVTGWADSLKVNTKSEEAYETAHLTDAGTTRLFASHNFEYQATRRDAFTAFVETDEVFHNDWGIDMPIYDEVSESITNWETIIQQIEKKCAAVMDNNTEDAGNYKSSKNAVNQFVAYHLMDGGMASSQFVQHYNEYGYNYGSDIKNPQQSVYSVNVWDYYTMKGSPRGLLKITQLPTSHEFYLNRISKYNDAYKGDYTEMGVLYNNSASNGLNIKVNITNGQNENNALNGFYYPIDHVLVFNNETRLALSKERVRVDVAAMFPELFSNNLRGASSRFFPNGYFKNFLNESQTTYLYYLKDGYVAHNGGWKDYQGDEFLASGRYDFVLRLPPVPHTGTYELRMGASLNTLRGMFQVYIGENPYDMQPIGLPIDQRETVDMIPGRPWVLDTDDEATARENDRNLRNQGYMKAPNYFSNSNAKGKTDRESLARNAERSTPALRRILITQTFDQNKVYYLRFKSALESSDTQFQLDYFEFVPTDIINGNVPEDIW